MKRRSLIVEILVLAIAAAVVPALLISFVNRQISSKALLDSIRLQQTEVARRIAEEVDGEIRRTKSLISIVAHHSSFGAGSRVERYEALHNLLREAPSLQEVMFVSPAGYEVLKVSQNKEPVQRTRRTENFREPFVGAPFFAGNRLPTVLISEPIRTFANPTRQGAVLAKLSFSSLNEVLRQARVGPQGTAFIVNDRGHVLAHPDEQKVYAHTNLFNLSVVQAWREKPAEPTDLQEYVDANGQTLIALAHPIPLLQSAVIVQQPKDVVYAPVQRMLNQFIGWALLFVSIFVVLATLVGWKILRPLRKLRDAAERVGRGERDVTLDIHTHDELEDVGHSFNNMARSLSDLERLRADMTHMIVHDLKMPLSSILPSLDALITGEMGPLTSTQVHFLQTSRRSGQEMLMLIQNLLDVSRLEEGKLKLQKEKFIPGDWAESVVYNFKPLAEGGKKKLSLSLGPDLLPVEGDMALLGRVLGNLISNALRHVPQATGEVTVTLYRDGNQLAVQVRDNGEGIPEEEQQRIFEKFVQVEGRTMAPRTGTGLGLAFCKMVVEAHGGRIVVYSQPKEGSQFTFYIPLSVASAASETSSKASASSVLR